MKVHRLVLWVGGIQKIEIPMDDDDYINRVPPHSTMDKLVGFESGPEGEWNIQGHANRTQRTWCELRRRVSPRKYPDGFICPVLLKHEKEYFTLVGIGSGDKELWRREFYNVNIAPDLQFMYHPAPTAPEPAGYGLYIQRTGKPETLSVYPSIKEGGPPVKDCFMELVYSMVPDLLKPKHQGPENFVAGRFHVLVGVTLSMDSILLGL
jgi:hypothetical protein